VRLSASVCLHPVASFDRANVIVFDVACFKRWESFECNTVFINGTSGALEDKELLHASSERQQSKINISLCEVFAYVSGIALRVHAFRTRCVETNTYANDQVHQSVISRTAGRILMKSGMDVM
jgi:hypothetical protein